jgi:hypothetical protein
MLVKTNANQRIKFGNEKFQILRNYPGINLGNTNDKGLGGLGCIDHSEVNPNFTVKMHEHQNDEILSYIRQGKVSHTDKREHQKAEIISADKLMLMNAGDSFWHEEETLGERNLINMQLFVRPYEPNMKSGIQFFKLPSEKSKNKWRFLAGPEETGAPLFWRSAVWFYDLFLEKESIKIPELEGKTGYLYLVSGNVEFNRNNLFLTAGDGLVIKNEKLEISSDDSADILFFLIDESAKYSKAGTLSGQFSAIVFRFY